MVLLNLIANSLWRERRLFGLWVMSLCLAVSGLLIVDVFRGSLTQTLEAEGQEILTADLSVSARRPLTDDEKQRVHEALSPNARFSSMTEMYAMASRRGPKPLSRLAAVRFLDDVYPLIGELKVERGGSTANYTGRELNEGLRAWVAPDILTLLNVKVGDPLKIGEATFTIDGVIRKDPTQTFRFGMMAPRIFVGRKFLGDTKLVQFGSTLSEELFAAVSPVPRDLKARVEKVLPDTALQVTVPTDLEQGSFRVLSRLMDFLGLTGLVTLTLGWIGVYYLGRRWLSLESTSAGILKCLGFTDRELLKYLLLKLIFILCLGVFGGGILAWALAQTVLPFVQASLPVGFTLSWHWSSTLLLILVGPLAGLLLMFPALRAVGREPPLQLIQGTSPLTASVSDFMAFTLTSSTLFFALTLLQARSWRVTLIFLAALLGTIALAAGLGFVTVRVIALARRRAGWRLHLALSQWDRRRSLAVLLVTVSAMSGLLSQLIPNLEGTLLRELETPAGIVRPALFLLDIQDEQLDPLKAFLKEHRLSASQSSPFIRARILKVNGKPYERAHLSTWTTREDENNSRFRNRGVNLSYREDLAPSETVVRGKPWAQMGHTWENAEISVEQGYAERLGLKLGDDLQFDVQGLELNAKIASIREINWDTFQPNFFILFKSGVLNEAPKTWIMTVNGDAKIKPGEMQSLISEHFPNVSSINVQEALDSAADLFQKLGSGLKLASGLCMALGLFVFLMILLFQLLSTQKDWMQLFVLGLSPRDILAVQLLTYGALCLIGIGLGSFLSLAMAATVTHFVFESHLVIDWPVMISILAVSMFLAVSGMVILSLRRPPKTSVGQLISD